MKRFIKLLIFFSLIVIHVDAQILINEFVASNSSTISDNAGEYDDWIELYNAGDSPVNLTGFYLTDNPQNPKKWSLPDITMPGHSYVLIWADDDSEQGSTHTNFKLDADGEFVAITDGIAFLDSISFSVQQTDVSLGRKQDGEPEWIFFYSPTPGASNILQKLPPPRFSHESGFYSSPFQLILESDYPDTWIFYSTDARNPTTNSAQYSGPIEISRTTIIRTCMVGKSMQPSDTVTAVYFFDLHPHLNVLSLITEPKNLTGATGIIDHPEQSEWEKPVLASYFDANGLTLFNENAGLRLHGGSSRYYNKKSFRLYFRDEYGEDELDYPLFGDQKTLNFYKRFVAHSNGKDMPASDEPECWSLLRNTLGHQIGRRLHIPYAANKIVNLFFNGDSLGLYTLLERIDDHYIESNFGEEDFDLIEKDQNGYLAKEGDLAAWEEMLRFFSKEDISVPENMEIACRYLNPAEFIRYHIVEMYCGNMDWPINNQYMFRPKKDGGQWRWILWDMDRTFGYKSYLLHHNALAYALDSTTVQYELERNRYSSSLIFKKLLSNEDFKNNFINTFADQLNTNLSTFPVISLIDSLKEAIAGDIGFEIAKWGSSERTWEANVERVRTFASERPAKVRNYICSQFAIETPLELQINREGEGTVRIHSILLTSFPWTGVYFKHVPLEIEAIPESGYHFSHWDGSITGTQSPLNLPMDSGYSLTAIFEQDTTGTHTEPLRLVTVPDTGYFSIYYRDTLMVTGGTPPYTFARDTIAGIFLDETGILSGFPSEAGIFTDSITVSDADSSHPEARFLISLVIIPPFNLVTVPDTGYCDIPYCDTLIVSGGIPPYTFTPDTIAGLVLNESGILAGLPSEAGTFSDYITIKDSNPSTPAATFVLQLIILQVTGVMSPVQTAPTQTRLFENYPNPFNHSTEIQYELHQAGHVRIRIFDMLGREIRPLVDAWQSAGEYKIQWDGKSRDGRVVPSGVYVYVLKTGPIVLKRKMILVQ